MYNTVIPCVTELLVKDLNLLAKHSLISMDQDGFLLQPTGKSYFFLKMNTEID